MGSSILIVGGDQSLRYRRSLEEIKKISKNPKWQEKNNPDFVSLASEDSLGIDEIRKLQNFLHFKPFNSQYKIAFIGQAEKLTTEAQNALLKTLEEPLEKSVVILSSPDNFQLLPTIVSRCQIIRLPLTSCIFLSEKETQDLEKLFENILKVGVGERFKILEELKILNERQKAIEFLNKMIFLVRKLLIDENLKEKSSKNLISQYFNILISLARTKTYLQANTNIRLTMENLLLNL